MLAALVVVAAPAWAAEGYRITRIADPLSGLGLPGPGWTLGGTTSLNNSGTVVYSAHAGTFGAEFRTGIFASDSLTMQTIATGLRIGTAPGAEVNWGAINNLGQVIYGYSTGVLADDATRLWDQGAVSTFAARTATSNYSPNTLAVSGLFSDQRTVAGSFSNQLLVRGQGGSESVVASSNACGAVDARLSSNGTWAMGISAFCLGAQTGLMVSGRGDVQLGLAADPSTPRPMAVRINNNGLGVYTSYRPGGDPGSNLLGVVDAKVAQGGVSTVLDTRAGFTRFGATQSGLAINNRNEIAFAAAPVGSPSGELSVYLTSTAGGTPRLVLAAGDAVGSDGTIFAGILDASHNSFQINDRGQISLSARLQRDGATFEGILRLDPEAGASAGSPLLPEAGAPLVPPPVGLPQLPPSIRAMPGWGFPMPSPARSRIYVDPDYAVGYAYSIAAGGPSFESILVPAPLPGGDASFMLQFAGLSFALQAGQIFQFTDHVAGGVSQFTLTGIDVAEQIDPQDAQGFVAGFTFIGGDGMPFSMQMNPLVTSVPEPAAGWMLLAGLGALVGRAVRWRRGVRLAA